MIGMKNTMIAAGLLALSTGAASAYPAVVTDDLHLRSGPATDYQVIGVLPQGADVRVQSCNEGWCRVSYAGREGFASEHYLDISQARMTPPIERGYAYRPGYRDYAYVPAYRDEAYVTPGYRDYAYAPGYRDYAYSQPAPLPNPLDFPLLPWNW
jgi:uncharacterized protein YraI